MLINRGHFWLHAPHRFNPGGNGLAFLHGNVTRSLGDSRFNNSVAFDKFAAIPNGATNQTAWVLPRRSGGMSSRNEAEFSITPVASGLRGVTSTGTATFGIDTNTPAGGLVVTVQPGDAPASIGLATNTPALTASISGVGSATFGIDTNTPLIGAEASLIATAEFGMDGTLTRYAIGIMEGTTEETGLSVPGIVNGVWSAVLSNYPDAGTAGNTLALAGSGGVDYTTLANAVWSAATRTLTSGGSAPTAEQVATAVFAHLVEAGFSFEEVIRIMAAALAGTSNKAGSTITFKGIDGTTDRIVGTYDTNNNRTSATLDGA